MKKTVLAFAVAAAMGVPAVAAADTTLYGLFHVSVDRADNGENSSNQILSRGSRLGVRGNEDLGGGLQGVFQVETGFDAVTGSGGFGGALRDTYVGVSGDFGQVRIARHITPFHIVTASTNVIGDSALDVRNIMGRVQGDGDNVARQSNGLMYISPNFSGVQVWGMYITDTASDAPSDALANDRDGYSLAATYRQGPLRLFAAYEKLNSVGKAGAVAPTQVLDAAGGSVGTFGGSAENAGIDVTAWTLGGGYTIDDLTVNVAFDRVERGNDNRNAYMLTARYNLGQAYLVGLYGSAGNFGSAADTGAKMYGAGAGYNFSRRTGVYAVYSKIDNDSEAQYGQAANFGAAPAGAGKDPSSFSIGLRHSF